MRRGSSVEGETEARESDRPHSRRDHLQQHRAWRRRARRGRERRSTKARAARGPGALPRRADRCSGRVDDEGVTSAAAGSSSSRGSSVWTSRWPRSHPGSPR
jgi:hypothetical protein